MYICIIIHNNVHAYIFMAIETWLDNKSKKLVSFYLRSSAANACTYTYAVAITVLCIFIAKIQKD